MSDSVESMDERYRRMLMSLTPSERAMMAGRMFSDAMTLVRAGLDAFDRSDTLNMRQRIFLRVYGHEFSPAERAKILERLGED